jgi:hypothetical protein
MPLNAREAAHRFWATTPTHPYFRSGFLVEARHVAWAQRGTRDSAPLSTSPRDYRKISPVTSSPTQRRHLRQDRSLVDHGCRSYNTKIIVTRIPGDGDLVVLEKTFSE